MPYPYTIVDAFAAAPFAGNPAAVYLLDAPRPESWLRLVAREMNLSETAYLLPESSGYRLRWFTPAAEVRLCGHATLASAHVLWQTGRLAPTEAAHFHTLSGELIATQDGDWITLDFPKRAPTPTDIPEGLATALGAPVLGAYDSADDLLVEVADAATVLGLIPNFGALKRLPVRGTIVTALAEEPGIDFVSRFFGPAVGVDEDPVTGSAHTVLAPFWAARLGRESLVGHQISPRGGVVRVQLQGERVLLGGQAITIARGELLTD